MSVTLASDRATNLLEDNLKKYGKVVLNALASPVARRYEVALALVVYEAIRTALGHA